LKEKRIAKKLFDRFKKELKKNKMILNKGKILDRSIVESPKQRNSRVENKEIKKGEIQTVNKEANSEE
jgi:hypothetical protein